MRARISLALYVLSAIWLAGLVAYLTYLLFPYEDFSLLTTMLVAFGALALFASLIRGLLWRPLQRGPIGRWRLATVLVLAAATLIWDAGWAHYLVPFPPTSQDNCTFGAIGPEEFSALKLEIAAKFDRGMFVASYPAKEELKAYLQSLLPEAADEAVMLAHIHALARVMGAELDGATYRKDVTSYGYRVDINRLPRMRAAMFRWATINFRTKQNEQKDGIVSVTDVWLILPSFKGPTQHAPKDRSCPRLPTWAAS